MDDLVKGLKAGDAGAFEGLVREYGDRLYRFVRRMVGDRDAEDVTQELLLRVHRSIRDYQPAGRFESWLFTIANNLCIDQVRRRKPESALSQVDSEVGAEVFADARAPEPVDDLAGRETHREILRAVARLPVDQRQVFLLREEAGMTFREIAQMLGCPLNTALGRMHYAMENLRKSVKALRE